MKNKHLVKVINENENLPALYMSYKELGEQLPFVIELGNFVAEYNKNILLDN